MAKKILWIEDEKDQYRAFSYKLVSDYELTRAIDYQNAMDIFKNNTFDMIIVDIILPSGFTENNIPKFDNVSSIYFGIELIKHFRSKNEGVPIIVVSVVTEKEKVDRIKNIDNDIQFVSKYDSTSEDVKELVDSIFN